MTTTFNPPTTTPLAQRQPASEPRTEVVSVDPALAEQWLSGNTVNRRIRDAAVHTYARDMTAGRWSLSPDAICFSPDGKLLNGQHRLWAVIESGRTVAMLIMRNVPESAMENMDSGIGRSAADALGFQGEQYTHALAAATKLAIIWSDGRLYKDKKTQRMSHGEIRQFIDENPDLRDAVAFAASGCGRVVELTRTAVAVTYWAFSRAAGEPEARKFFEQLASLVGLPSGSPILALDSRMRDVRRSRTNITHREELALVVKSWNYWREERSAQKLSLRAKGGDLPIVPPVSG